MTHVHDTGHSVDPTQTGEIVRGWKINLRGRLYAAEKRARTLVQNNEGVGLGPEVFYRLAEQHIGGTWFKDYVLRAYRRGLLNAAVHAHGKPQRDLTPTDRSNLVAAVAQVKKEYCTVEIELARQLSAGVHAAPDVSSALTLVGERFTAIGIARGSAVASVNAIAVHARAQLAYYRQLGIRQVGAVVEGIPRTMTQDAKRRKPRRGSGGRFASRHATLATWQTAGDNDVCPQCEEMEGKVFDLDEAEGLIPLHPNCRCMWVPHDDNLYETLQELTAEGVNPEELV